MAEELTGRAPRAVRAGDALGRYEIGEEIGEGGMATVFRARDRELRRDVAVKVLFPHLARRAEVVRRFHREARAAAGLEHPNILRIYDVGGGDDDPPYIVMELIRGRTLLQEIEQRGAMLAEIAACIGALLADALTAAHAAGIVHRDIKPSNVLIAPGGRLLLADFGVARLETEDSLVTRTGALLGTPAYMSPEQASGEIATARSDLYSLGATLYQLATGVVPYGGNPAKVISALAAGQLVAPIRRRAAVGAELSRAIEQLMAKEAAARPATAAAVAAALREIAARGDFGDPTDELAAYFADPAEYLRVKTPAVVRALVRDTRRAIDADQLPRALALADRASALAGDDAEVVALVEAVTEGGRAKRRRRVVTLAGAGIVLAGGATAGAFAIDDEDGGGDARAPVVIAADAAIELDARPVIDAAEIDAVVIDAAIADAPIVSRAKPRAASRALSAPPPVDAAIELDAAIIVAADAAIDAAIAAAGTLTIENDTWCNLEIDGEDRGRITQPKSLELPAGTHSVRCTQPNTGLGWERSVVVRANQQHQITESLIPAVDIVIATPGTRATIDGAAAARGQTVRLKAGQHHVRIFDGAKELASGWVAVPRARVCRLHRLADGKIVCDP